MTVIAGQTGLQTITAGDLLTFIRQYISESNPATISDTQLLSDLNWVWQYRLPQSNSTFGLIDTWIFSTQAGVDTYPFPLGQIITIQDETLMVDRVPAKIFRSDYKQLFYITYSNRTNFNFINEAGDTTGPFSYTIGGQIARGYQSLLGVFEPQFQVNFSDSAGNGYVLIDNGDGNLYYEDPVGTFTPYGTVNYYTGAFSFTTPVNAAGRMWVNYDATGWGYPSAGLFCDNNIVLKVIPNQPYRVSCMVQYTPNPFIDLASVLPLTIYAEYLILATALRIVKRNSDQQQTAFLTGEVQEATDRILNANAKNMTPSRKQTPFCHAGGTAGMIGVFPNPFPYGSSSLL